MKYLFYILIIIGINACFTPSKIKTVIESTDEYNNINSVKYHSKIEYSKNKLTILCNNGCVFEYNRVNILSKWRLSNFKDSLGTFIITNGNGKVSWQPLYKWSAGEYEKGLREGNVQIGPTEFTTFFRGNELGPRVFYCDSGLKDTCKIWNLKKGKVYQEINYSNKKISRIVTNFSPGSKKILINKQEDFYLPNGKLYLTNKEVLTNYSWEFRNREFFESKYFNSEGKIDSVVTHSIVKGKEVKTVKM